MLKSLLMLILYLSCINSQLTQIPPNPCQEKYFANEQLLAFEETMNTPGRFAGFPWPTSQECQYLDLLDNQSFLKCATINGFSFVRAHTYNLRA